MKPPSQPAAGADWLTRGLLCGCGYLPLAVLGQLYVVQPSGIAVLWPASGYLLGLLLHRPAAEWPRLLPFLFLGDLVAELTYTSMLPGLSYALVNLAEGIAGALGLRWLSGGRFTLGSVRSVLMLLLVVLGGSAPLAATAGTGLTWLAGGTAEPGAFWRVWWISTALGSLTIAPLTLSLLEGEWRRLGRAARVELGLVVLGTAALAASLFEPGQSVTGWLPPALYIPFPLLMWAAVRFELLGAASANLALAMPAVWNLCRAPTTASADAAEVTLLLVWVQAYLMVLQSSSLVLAAVVRDRHRTHEALRRSESLLSAVLEHTPAALQVKDLSGRYRMINRVGARQLGRTTAEIVGRTDAELMSPERAAAVAAIDRQVLESGRPFQCEEEILTEAGSRTCLAVRFPVRDSEGRIQALGGIRTDISELKQAELDLQASEQLRKGLLDASPLIIYLFDLEAFRMVYLSQRVLDYLGSTSEDLLRQSPLGLFAALHPEDEPATRKTLLHWHQDPATGPRHQEYRLRDRQGQWRWFLERSTVFRHGARGEPRQILGVVEDITRQKQADTALRERARLAVLEASVSKALNQNLPLRELAMLCTEALARSLDASRVELWYRESAGAAFVPLAQWGRVGSSLEPQLVERLRHLQPVVQPGASAGPEGTCQTSLPLVVDGHLAGTILLELGEVPGPAVVHTLELTAGRVVLGLQRRQAEEAVRRLNADLERRVRERTEELRRQAEDAELLNRGMINLLDDLQRAQDASESVARQLRRANEELDFANRELEAFSYSVSHDLRAPLRNVTGFVELLERTFPDVDDRTRGYLGVISREMRRMGDLIGDLLTFSRLSRVELHKERVLMRDVVQTVWARLQPECKDRQIAWALGELPAVQGDPRLLELVWTNLLANALKYSRPRARGEIQVGAQPAAEDAPERVFYVRDNGVGFDMKYAHKLFGVFQRLHSPKDFEGTGIGLANVQRIVRRHGGRVWAEAEKDRGATFYFSLPTG